MEYCTLYELNLMVREIIEDNLSENYWVTAELSEVRESVKGHCFIELVEREENTNTIKSKARGVIMRNIYELLKLDFERQTGQTFCAGLKVLLQVNISFSEVYGYSLIVTDIDPTYTLGYIAQRRKEIIERLIKDGVAEMNKELDLPELLQRVAVISSPKAAGFEDFCNQLDNNSAGFIFNYKLFPAVMQGEMVEKTIIEALDTIAVEMENWDAVVIIRGGGAVSDLSGFDTYNLANHCAQFPLPIFTGIGHERDVSVLDFVANRQLKTPTAVASFLIEKMSNTVTALENIENQLYEVVENILDGESEKLSTFFQRLDIFGHLFLTKFMGVLDKYEGVLFYNVSQHLKFAEIGLADCEKTMIEVINHKLLISGHKLQTIENELKVADPARILKLGYSITLKDGKSVRDASKVRTGDKLETKFAKGKITSIAE